MTNLEGFVIDAGSGIQTFGIERLEFLWDEEAILPDEFLVEIDFAAPVVRPLDTDEIPVDLAAVAIIGPFVGLAGREMKRTRNLLVEENVAHWRRDIGIEPEREFANVPRPVVRIEYSVEALGIIRGGLDHFAVFKCKSDRIKRGSLVDGWGIE